MALIWKIACPKCQKEFIVQELLYEMDVELLCPYCDLYFKKEKSASYSPPSGSSASLSFQAAQASRYKIYKPREKTR